MTREFAAVAGRVLRGEETPPAPIMRWMAPVTLGGIVATTRVEHEAIAENRLGESALLQSTPGG
jgi:hypothetical protein